MEKIRCPHCGAVNQDVTSADNCWQCSKRLGDPPTTATEESAGSTPGGQAVKQLQRPTLEERVAARKAERKQPLLTPAILIALLAIVALVVFLILRSRG